MKYNISEHQEIFEWYQVYDNLKEKIGDLIKPEDKVLYIGSGTSSNHLLLIIVHLIRTC